jgi:hypothetical protein
MNTVLRNAMTKWTKGVQNRLSLDPLLEPDQVAAIQDFMNTLDFEVAIQELLDRNERALARLEELQTQRLGEENGGTSQVEVGSEEWDVGASSTHLLDLATLHELLLLFCSPSYL